MPLLEGLDGVEKMSKSKGNTVALTDAPNDMFAKLLSISDTMMWRYFSLLSFRTEPEIARFKADIEEGRNPKQIKVLLAKEITARFHSAALADEAEVDFDHRARGGVPDEIAEMSVVGAPMGIGALLKQANLAASTGEALRLVDGRGVRVDGALIEDRGLKLAAGTYVLQVGKRKFARVTLS